MNPTELVDGIETTTFAGIVLALYVKRVAAAAYGPICIAALANFSGLSPDKLRRMCEAEECSGVDVKKHGHGVGHRRLYYSPTKVALANALAESLSIGADAKAEHGAMLRYRP